MNHEERQTQDLDWALYQSYLSATGEERGENFADTARAAEITGLSRRTILMWIETGKLVAIRIGKKHQVSLKSLNEYLTSLSER